VQQTDQIHHGSELFSWDWEWLTKLWRGKDEAVPTGSVFVDVGKVMILCTIL
jgi:hypothetical protein